MRISSYGHITLLATMLLYTQLHAEEPKALTLKELVMESHLIVLVKPSSTPVETTNVEVAPPDGKKATKAYLPFKKEIYQYITVYALYDGPPPGKKPIKPDPKIAQLWRVQPASMKNKLDHHKLFVMAGIEKKAHYPHYTGCELLKVSPNTPVIIFLKNIYGSDKGEVAFAADCALESADKEKEVRALIMKYKMLKYP